jgi:uncharacterized protein (TIGR00369 family)
LLAEAKHANPAGFVHGGALAGLIDHALSAIAWEASQRRPCVTVALETHFVAPARPREFLEARGRVIRQTRSLVFLQGAISAQDRVVLTASAVMTIVTATSR